MDNNWSINDVVFIGSDLVWDEKAQGRGGKKLKKFPETVEFASGKRCEEKDPLAKIQCVLEKGHDGQHKVLISWK